MDSCAPIHLRYDKAYLPDWSYPKIVTTARNTISGAPFDDDDSAIWADIKAKISALDISAQPAEELRLAAKNALLQSVAPAYQRLIAELERLGTEAPAADGVWKMPNGAAYYAERLNYFTTTDLSAEQIHKIGLREVDRIHSEMRAIMEQVEFEGTLQE